MASSTPPLLSSSPSSIADLQQWLIHVTTTFRNHLSDNNTLPVCIFQLPQTLTSEKPDSYLPQHIGLGPIHHFQTHLYAKQQQLKIITAKNILPPHISASKFERIVHERLVPLARAIRYCYDLYFDADDELLAWIFAIDGLFLVDVLTKVADGRPSEALEDVVMVENQIPFVILVELLNQKVIGDIDDSSLSNLLVRFCESEIPFKFDKPISQLDLDMNSSFHLLDCMYRLIVNRNLPPENPFLRTNFMFDVNLGDVENSLQMAGGLCPGANVFLQPVLIILKLPWDKVGDFIKKIWGANSIMPEIDIPSASLLARIAKIEFYTNHGGIRDIEFDEGKLRFSLPVLELKSNSEVLLRNLVAYEGLMFEKGNITNLVLTEYVDLMCGIVDGVKDVKILQEKDIITGDLKDDDIVKLLNGISKSRSKTKNSALQKTVAKVNNHYGNIPRVKAYRFIKKKFLALWKVFAIVFSIFSLVLMIVYGVCQVYECRGHFGLHNVRLLVAYATGGDNQWVGF